MKIAYVTEYDAKNVREWSGLGYFISQSLIKQGAEITFIGPLKTSNHFYHKLKEKFYSLFFKKKYRPNRNPRVLKNYAKQILQKIPANTEVIFCPASTTIAQLKTEVPIVFYTDATFGEMVNFYPEFKLYCKETIRDAHKMEQSSIDKCSLAIYSSDWAANSAIKHYHADKNKLRVLSFGANIQNEYTENQVLEFIRNRSNEVLKLLFLGVYWERKGGDVALDVAKYLNNSGVKTELHIVGYTPDFEVPDYVKVHGFLSKDNENDVEKFNSMLKTSHFLILPSIADCTPVVFSEANSVGLPVISTKVGGIPTVVKDGINGKLFDLGVPASEYGEYIKEIYNDKDSYYKMAKSSYSEYKKRLNWEFAGKKLLSWFKDVI